MTAVQALFLSNSLLPKKEKKKVTCVCEHMECERKTSHLKAGVQIYKTKKNRDKLGFYFPRLQSSCATRMYVV